MRISSLWQQDFSISFKDLSSEKINNIYKELYGSFKVYFMKTFYMILCHLTITIKGVNWLLTIQLQNISLHREIWLPSLSKNKGSSVNFFFLKLNGLRHLLSLKIYNVYIFSLLNFSFERNQLYKLKVKTVQKFIFYGSHYK